MVQKVNCRYFTYGIRVEEVSEEFGNIPQLASLQAVDGAVGVRKDLHVRLLVDLCHLTNTTFCC
jgi:hypothetical protein